MVNKDIHSQQSHISGAYSPTRIKTQIITSFKTVVQDSTLVFLTIYALLKEPPSASPVPTITRVRPKTRGFMYSQVLAQR